MPQDWTDHDFPRPRRSMENEPGGLVTSDGEVQLTRHGSSDAQPEVVPRVRNEWEEVRIPQVGRQYDPAKLREKLRATMAVMTFALFAGVVGWLLFAVIMGGKSWNDLEGLTAAILPAVSSVVSAALAFYFTSERGKG